MNLKTYNRKFTSLQRLGKKFRATPDGAKKNAMAREWIVRVAELKAWGMRLGFWQD